MRMVERHKLIGQNLYWRYIGEQGHWKEMHPEDKEKRKKKTQGDSNWMESCLKGNTARIDALSKHW